MMNMTYKGSVTKSSNTSLVIFWLAIFDYAMICIAMFIYYII